MLEPDELRRPGPHLTLSRSTGRGDKTSLVLLLCFGPSNVNRRQPLRVGELTAAGHSVADPCDDGGAGPGRFGRDDDDVRIVARDELLVVRDAFAKQVDRPRGSLEH